MQAHVTACQLMDLHAFWTILHAFWNILHALWNIHTACILEHSACILHILEHLNILEHSACILNILESLCDCMQAYVFICITFISCLVLSCTVL